MAHSKSALKRWRQNEAHRERNKPVRSQARSSVRKARALIASASAGASDEAAAAIREATSILDRAAKRNVIHRNAAARQKSRLMRHLNEAGTTPRQAEAPKRARKTAAKKTSAKPKAAAKPRAPRAKKTTE